MESVPDAVFLYLLDRLDPEQPVSVRSSAVQIFSKAKLSQEQLGRLAEAIGRVGPLEVDRLLGVFEQSTDATVGHKLLAALSGSPTLAALSVGMLKPRLAKFPQDVQDEAEKLYARLDRKASEARARLEELLESLPAGDVRRGQLIFNSTKAACSSCHAIGYLGGKLGPDLTRIGQVRQRRDLLESIVFPSASFVRSYEPLMVVTASGRIETGLLRKDALAEVVLAKSATEEVHIARDDIEELLPGTVSIMPQGLDRQLSLGELADLVAFLEACK
jgi:putative heme-binding domain-containing protein